MDRWAEFQVFVKIAEEGSMTRAAEALNNSTSGVSRQLTSLESRLGVRLIQRSTRQLSLTDEGERLYGEARDLLSTWEEAEANVRFGAREPTGRLRIGASLSFSLLHLVPAVAAFRKRYPQLAVELVSSNRYYDLIENGLDLAIRLRRVESDSSITIRRIAESRRLLAASPEYLAQRGVPQHPRDLSSHDMILYSLADNWNDLHFTKGSEQVKIAVDGALVMNDGQLICNAARRGLGIVAQPTYILQEDLDAGRLVRLLDEWDLPRLTMNIAYPSKYFVPLRTRLFIDFLVDDFRRNGFEKRWTA